jgi:(2S)-methylsuccinyl-CoA dehydrogenase
MPAADLASAASVLDLAHEMVQSGLQRLRAAGGPDAAQVLAYDLAHAASALETARAMLDYGSKGDEEARLTCAFVADAVYDLGTRVLGREGDWGVTVDALAAAHGFLATYRAPEFLASLASTEGPRHLDSDFEMVQDTFRRFAEERIKPVAERVHRHNEDVPEEIISGLAEMGAFGLSVPEEYGGFASGGESDYLGMVVATEELSRGSLGIGGSLITRPEILTRPREGRHGRAEALLAAEAGDRRVMVAVAVTEPDFGSDVANLTVRPPLRRVPAVKTAA